LPCGGRNRIVVLEALGASKAQRAFACEEDMRCGLHDSQRDQDRITHTLECRNATACEIMAGHDCRVHLDRPFQIQN